jgi:glycosyltransferase involved in cell wall biosynthesis
MQVPPGSVWVDAQGTQDAGSAERGIGRYIVEVTSALHAIQPEVFGSMLLDPRKPVPRALQWLTGSGLLGELGPEPAAGSDPPLIYHVPSPFEDVALDAIWPEWVRRGESGIRTVVTLLDLIPLVMAEQYLDPNPPFKAAYTARLGLIREADHVLAISECSARDAVEHLGIDADRITVIELGASDTFSSLVGAPDQAAARLESSFPRIREGFLLYVGGGDPRKNLEGTIEGFSRMAEAQRHAHQLVIVCRLGPDRTAELRAFARGLGIADADLLLAGFVPDADLAAMYGSCALFVFPSLYEGFGLPILEAMSCGAPVAASNNSSIPEVLGDLEATFDPADPGDIAATLEAVFETPGRLNALRERSRRQVQRHTWRKTAEKTLLGYERALALPPHRQPRRRGGKRMAVVTPWPPEQSIGAAHSEHVVDVLAEHVDADLIVPGGGESRRSAAPRVRLWPASGLAWLRALRGYDRYLYVLGASPADAPILEALAERPGLVVLHDVRLIGLYQAMQESRHRDDPDWLRDKLIERYASADHPPPLGKMGGVKASETYVEQGIFFTQEVQEQAEGLVVHSQYQADVLSRERPDRAAPTSVLGAPVPQLPRSLNGTRRPGGPLAVSCGAVDLAGKRVGPLLEGFAKLASEHPDAQLVMMGRVGEGERAAIARTAAKLGVGSSVELRGRVDAAEYWSTLGAADLAVQLRSGPDGGVVSGSVCDAVGARVPTVVSDVGWFSELPDPVVAHVGDACPPAELAAQMASLLDEDVAAVARAAQDQYAAENSFARLAERYAELLEL